MSQPSTSVKRELEENPSDQPPPPKKQKTENIEHTDSKVVLLNLFYRAIKYENIELCQSLISEKANVNLQYSNGNTPLMLLLNTYSDCGIMNDCYTDITDIDEQIFELLIKNNTDITIQNKDGITALDMAARYHLPSVCEKLIANKANINREHNDGGNVLHYAVHNSIPPYYYDIFKLLIANKVDINKQDNNGCTPLHLLSSYEMCELLITNEADVNKQYKDYYEDICKLFIENKADINIKDKEGNTALMNAASHDDSLIYESLLKCHVNKMNNDDKLQLAKFISK